MNESVLVIWRLSTWEGFGPLQSNLSEPWLPHKRYTWPCISTPAAIPLSPCVCVDTSACQEVAPGVFGPSCEASVHCPEPVGQVQLPFPTSFLMGLFFFLFDFFLSCSMTLLFISLLPYNSVGLDFGLSCFFMWLLCFLIGWRSWPECQCPRIRYCTLPGEVESEMPLFPYSDTLPFWNIQPSPPPACIPASPSGKRGSSLLELSTST